MFYYFGSKRRLVSAYPSPEFPLIVEPFAGSAGYSCAHHTHEVLLIEKDSRITGLWDRLRSMTTSEILSIPCPEIGTKTTDILTLTRAVSEHSLTSKYITVQPRLVSRWPQMLARIAVMVPLIQHWTVLCGDYQDAPNIEATWFIDPPYQHKQRGYAFRPDYAELADFCRSRKGQVIVCEQAGADWLPFQPLKEIKGVNGKRTTEVFWCNP